ncbi:MAG: papain-like cysteine protease family protein [Pseudomonadota bacterium]
MPYVNHAVPLIGQSRQMSCWYAAVCMIGAYFEAGPRQGLKNIWLANQGIADNQIQALAEAENLHWLRAADHDYSAATLGHDLRKFGPMFSICHMPQGKHVLVVTGVNDIGTQPEMLYNDPAGGGREGIMPLETWNKRRHRGYLLVRDRRTWPRGFFMKMNYVPDAWREAA